MTREVRIERDGSIATVTLNQPEKMNAMTAAMWGQLADGIKKLSADDDLRVIIIRGAGGKAFCTGNDISKFKEERGTSLQAKQYEKNLHRAFHALDHCRHPLVAMIQGPCVGGGLEIAALCDIRICGLSSRFAVPINRLGLVLAYPELEILYRLAGRSVASELLLEGRVYEAGEALQKGLVHRVFADEDVASEAGRAARKIAAGAPLSARQHKKFLRRLENPAPVGDAEKEEAYACYDTEDFREGYRSFLEKRPPDFKGR